jgi:FixJ family two-component response regulator
MPKPLLVSVVEDDQFFRESVRRLMRSLGYPVEGFSSAADFLASPHLLETACLVVDVQMPVMSGLELHRTLIEAGYVIPTILVTAYPNAADHARARDAGVVCYLAKPMDELHLMECLHKAFASNAENTICPAPGKVNRNTAP